MIRCQICGGDCSWTNDLTTFYPNVRAHVCADCSNQISIEIESLPEWQSVVELDARKNHYEHLALAQTPVSEEKVLDTYKKTIELKQAIRPKVLEMVSRKTEAANANQ